MVPVVVFALSLLSEAQGFDARGPSAPPDSGDPADAPWIFGPGGRDGSIGTTSSFIDRAVVRVFPGGGETPLLDDVWATEFTGLTPSLGPAQLGLVLPVIWSSAGEVTGTRPADLRVYLPITLNHRSFGVRITPTLRLPTGNALTYVADEGVGGGGMLSMHGRTGPVVLGVDAGVQLDGAEGIVDWPDGPRVQGAASVGWVPTDALGLHVGWRTRFPIAGGTVPSELGGAVKIRAPFGGFATAGGSRALTRGIGAPALRVEVGFGFSPAGPAPIVTTPVDPTLQVRDASDRPMRGITVVLADGTIVTTDAFGTVDLPPGGYGTAAISVPGYVDAQVDLDPSVVTHVVTLARTATPIRIRMLDGEGRPVLVAPVMTPAPVPALVSDDLGTWRGTLPPGTYTLLADAPGSGQQTRTVTVGATSTEEIDIDVVLHPALGSGIARVTVVDPQGEPVAGAQIRLDGVLYGSTGPAGDIRLDGLPLGSPLLEVGADPWADPTPIPLTLGMETTEVTAGWPDGGVLVRVQGPDGTATDALVAFRGPTALPPAALGSDGERLFRLRPGLWTLVVSSPTLGIQERRLELAPEARQSTVLHVVMRPAESGDADLSVEVVGPEGPIAGADVRLGGQAVGATGPDGTLRLLGLARGTRRLEVSSPLMRPAVTEVDLFGGGQGIEIPVSWAPGAVEVRVMDPAGHPVDALAITSNRGTSPRPPLQLGADGTERFVLPAGRWDVAISSPEWGTQVRTLTVGNDSDAGLRRIDVRMLPPDDDGGGLELTVRDIDGAPVDGALVTFEGQPLGTTTDGSLIARSLPRTTVAIRVEASAMQPVIQRIRVTERTPVDVVLPWAPGALAVDVSGTAGPVDALLAISGPLPKPSMRTGPDGRALMALSPGGWRVLASTEALGASEVGIVLPDAPRLTQLPIVLGPPPAIEDVAVLLVRVRDLDGAPIEGLAVGSGGQHVVTSSGGSALLTNLEPGDITVQIDGGNAYSDRDLKLALAGGSHQRIVVVERRARAVHVRAVDPTGRPVAARVVAEGVDTAVGSSDGIAPARLRLPPGPWRITARSESGIGTEGIALQMGPDALEVDIVVSALESRIEGDRVILGQPIPFDLGRASLRASAEGILDDVARLLIAEGRIRTVEVAGHTDDQGGVAYNQELSERRGAVVGQALIDRGVDPERLRIRGYGLMRPVASGVDAESRAMNRRVEIVVVEGSGD